MVLQVTGGANAYRDAQGLLRIEESEFLPPGNPIWGNVSFDTARERALIEARYQLLKQIHEANRRMIRAQERESSGVTMEMESNLAAARYIDGYPDMSLNDIKL